MIIVFTVHHARKPLRWFNFPAITRRIEVFTKKITLFCSIIKKIKFTLIVVCKKLSKCYLPGWHRIAIHEITSPRNNNKFAYPRTLGHTNLNDSTVFCQYIFAISWLPHLEKRHGPSFEQPGIPITQECFILSLDEMGQLVLEKIYIFFKTMSKNLLFIVIISPWRTWSFISAILNPHFPRRLCVKFG